MSTEKQELQDQEQIESMSTEKPKPLPKFSYSSYFKIAAGAALIIGGVAALVFLPHIILPVTISSGVSILLGLGFFAKGCHEARRVHQERTLFIAAYGGYSR